jgi:hypothetical protein
MFTQARQFRELPLPLKDPLLLPQRILNLLVAGPETLIVDACTLRRFSPRSLETAISLLRNDSRCIVGKAPAPGIVSGSIAHIG